MEDENKGEAVTVEEKSASKKRSVKKSTDVAAPTLTSAPLADDAEVASKKPIRKRKNSARAIEVEVVPIGTADDNAAAKVDEVATQSIAEISADVVPPKRQRKQKPKAEEPAAQGESLSQAPIAVGDVAQEIVAPVSHTLEFESEEDELAAARGRKTELRAAAKEKRRVDAQRRKAEKKRKKLAFDTPLERVDADFLIGLDEEQVKERQDRGLSNIQPKIVTKSYLAIFRSNVLTLFNLLNFFLAGLILVFGSIKNMLFMGIVLCNTVIGIIQEIRSKLTLEKMSLLNTPHVDVVRGGKTSNIAIDDIVLDDVIKLKQGGQIPADCVLVHGGCEANESLLTGEQDDVAKGCGDMLYSGSFVQAGECYARVTAVGKDNFSAKIMSEAKKYKKAKSELMRSINWIIRIVTIIIFPLGIMMFFTNLQTASTVNKAVTNSVASVLGMIPEGLIVLTSMALAVGIIKLARKRTLVQELYSIETLARVDLLCLDKTGTITEGTMQVEHVHGYASRNVNVDEIMASMVAALNDKNSTFEAFANYFHSDSPFKAVKTVPFSSSRKWSAADFGENGKFIVGAPEFVLKSRVSLVQNDVTEYAGQGFRVLVLVKTTQTLGEAMDVEKMRPVALIVLSDKIRENAKATFDYFEKQGVALKVISGDNPITVSKVAERAGLKGADKYIDASVDLDTDEKIYEACDKYTIFGRVSPKQKKTLVMALKSKGHTVGMTGDGVNDVMALKEADCSIAMASGSEASRNVAQLVLLDSDFAALPSVVGEGRRVINNIERASSLFLVKTTFSVVLTLLMICFKMNYPFEPIQLTLISSLFVGIPSFFLALEPNDTKVSGNFLSKVFKNALPGGFAIALLVWIACFIYNDVGIDVSAQVATMAFYITSLVSFAVLMKVCMPYTKERLFLMAMCLIAYMAAITSSFLRGLFSLTGLTTDMIVKLIILLVCAVPTIFLMSAEVEAFKALFKEIKGFFVNVSARCKKLFGKKKED